MFHSQAASLTLFLLLFAGLPLLFGVPAMLRSLRKRTAERSGRLMVGTVLSTVQTGMYSGHDPQLRVHLAVKDAAGRSGQAVLTKIYPMSSLPQPGDTMSVVLNPKNAAEAFDADETATRRSDDRTAEVLRAYNGVPASMRNNRPQVGDIASITPVGDGTDSYQVNVVHLGQPPAPVFCQQSFPDGHPYAVGDRVYLVTDNDTPPRNGYIMPLSFTHGEKLVSTGNRADLLLGDALLLAGARATGTVLSATPSTLTEAYQSRHASKWELQMQILPADGSTPYQGDVTIVANTEARAADVTQVGKTLPVRYDPYDKPTFVIDVVALGWGDPALFRQQLKQAHMAETGQSA